MIETPLSCLCTGINAQYICVIKEINIKAQYIEA
jgi:hypothetical protein